MVSCTLGIWYRMDDCVLLQVLRAKALCSRTTSPAQCYRNLPHSRLWAPLFSLKTWSWSQWEHSGGQQFFCTHSLWTTMATGPWGDTIVFLIHLLTHRQDNCWRTRLKSWWSCSVTMINKSWGCLAGAPLAGTIQTVVARGMLEGQGFKKMSVKSKSQFLRNNMDQEQKCPPRQVSTSFQSNKSTSSPEMGRAIIWLKPHPAQNIPGQISP